MSTIKQIVYRDKLFIIGDNDCNADIRITPLKNDLMRQAGFTEANPANWYYCRRLPGKANDITFNLVINKKDPSIWRIDILDESFLQPYDYQAMIEREVNGEKFDGDFHWLVDSFVTEHMEHLIRLGIISGWERGDYI